MPLLAGLLEQAFVGVIAFFGIYVGKKVATAFALAAFLVAGWVALSESLHLIQSSIVYIVPAWAQGAMSVAGYLLPSNTWSVIGAIIAAHWARKLWDHAREWGKAVAIS